MNCDIILTTSLVLGSDTSAYKLPKVPERRNPSRCRNSQPLSPNAKGCAYSSTNLVAINDLHRSVNESPKATKIMSRAPVYRKICTNPICHCRSAHENSTMKTAQLYSSTSALKNKHHIFDMPIPSCVFTTCSDQQLTIQIVEANCKRRLAVQNCSKRQWRILFFVKIVSITAPSWA